MDQQWVAKSLTIWGVIIAVITAALPAISLVSPEIGNTITPDWLAHTSDAVKSVITSTGVIIGAVMVVVDRINGTEVKKTLVLRPEGGIRKALGWEIAPRQLVLAPEPRKTKPKAKPKSKKFKVIRKKVIHKPKR